MTDEELLSILRELATKVDPAKLDRFIANRMKENKDILLLFQKDQLAAGLTSLDRDLSPGYLGDPFFKTEKRAKQYSDYKAKLPEKPALQYGAALGMTPASGNTPNLYITGEFYDTLTVDKVDFVGGKEDIEIGSTSGIMEDVASKYGKEVLGITQRFMDFYHEYYTRMDLEDIYFKFLT